MKARLFAGALALVTLLALAACGGGGGGGGSTDPVTPPPATATYSFTSTTTSLVVQADQSFAQATLNWSTSNAGNVSIKDAASKVIGSGPSGSAIVNVPVGTATFALFDGSTMQKSLTLSAGCISGATVDNSGNCRMAPPVVHYGETLIGYWGITNGLPRKTLPDGTQVNMVNKTKHASFLNCLPVANNQKNADGTIPHSCAATFGTDRYTDIALNPVTMEMVDAPTPVGVTYIPLTYDASRNPANRPTWQTSALYQNGDYAFVDQASNSVVRKLSAAGIESVIYAGTFEKDNGCFLLMIFSNP